MQSGTTRLLLVFFVFLLNLSSAFAQLNRWRDGEMEVRITFTNPTQMEILGAMKLDGEIYSSGACMYLTPDELQKVKEAGLNYQIAIADLNKWSASFGPALVPPGYYTVNEMTAIADSLATHFPDICRKVVFGFTPQFKELAALKISDNVFVDENEAEILMDGGIHGNEVGASQNVIQFARDLCLAYGNDPYISNLIDNREIWLYYCVNPYGRDNMIRENSFGVDINRDFGYMWGGEGSSPDPFSQPESRALRDCQYSNQFTSYTNFHSGIEIISYPWSYRYSISPDNAHHQALAEVYSQNSGYSNLTYGQGSQIMYLIQGSTKDFNYACLGSVAWSMEISVDKQPAGPNIQYFYNINKPAMLALVEHAGYGVEGTVTDAITGQPVRALVWVGNNYPTYTDGDAGDYHKYMIPGTYTLRFTANGYDTLEVSNVVVNNLQSTVTNVQLHPLKSQFAYRTVTSRIPAFNAQNPGDEGYTAACLGPPDQVSYSLGRGGYIIVDMQTPVKDEPGIDITVYEGDGSPEGYSLYALEDMDADWKLMGSANGTFYFDLATSGLSEAQYFALLDDNNGTANVSNAGFEFDAIQNVHAAAPDTLAHISGTIFDTYSGLTLSGAEVRIGDSVIISDADGHYSLDPLRGSYIGCASLPDYNQECDTLLLQAGTSTTHDFYLNYNVGVSDEHDISQFVVLPNPFNDELNVRFTSKAVGKLTVRLTSVDGKVNIILHDLIFQSGQNTINVWNKNNSDKMLQRGLYFLTLQSDTFTWVEKVIKY